MIRYDLVLDTFSLFILKIPDSILCLQSSDSFKNILFFVGLLFLKSVFCFSLQLSFAMTLVSFM